MGARDRRLLARLRECRGGACSDGRLGESSVTSWDARVAPWPASSTCLPTRPGWGGRARTPARGSGDSGGYDLVTVLEHELGHILAFDPSNPGYESHLQTINGMQVFVRAEFQPSRRPGRRARPEPVPRRCDGCDPRSRRPQISRAGRLELSARFGAPPSPSSASRATAARRSPATARSPPARRPPLPFPRTRSKTTRRLRLSAPRRSGNRRPPVRRSPSPSRSRWDYRAGGPCRGRPRTLSLPLPRPAPTPRPPLSMPAGPTRVSRNGDDDLDQNLPSVAESSPSQGTNASKPVSKRRPYRRRPPCRRSHRSTPPRGSSWTTHSRRSSV